MEKAIKKRSPLRGMFTRNINQLNGLLEEKKSVEARASLSTIEDILMKISELDDQIMDFMLEEDAPEEDISKEVEAVYDYRSKLDLIKVRVLDMALPTNAGDHNSVCSHNTTRSHPSYNLRLPKIEIHKFSGDLKEWLPFWNQFQRIHEDESLPAIDKFYYLDQAIVRNSRAWRVVESFPHSDENYPLAINALKERFGREDLLIEIYIRELLNLTLPSSKSCPLAEMYDKLECRLRALEVLGVTKGKCAAVICPLLESCMTEEYLKVWQRSCSSETALTAESRLDKFMQFMKNEVQNQERIDVALKSFSDRPSKSPKVLSKPDEPKFSKKHQVPTATGLMTVSVQKGLSSCIFCDEAKHSSVDCYKARDMQLSERIEVVKRNKCCLICMKRNHIAKFCKFKQKCLLCDRKHVPLLCPNLKRSNADVPEKTEAGVVPVEGNVLANVTSDKVLLPTIMVNIRGTGVQKTARAVIDTGSQRSYVLRKTAQEMNYLPTSEETIVHTLFGGQRSGICKHNMYKLYLSSIDGKYVCNFDVLDQDVICDNVPDYKHGPWVDEAKNLDLTENMFSTDSNCVEILIGADVIGKILTGNVKQLSCGVTAMETRLGWTLLGKQPIKPVKKTTAMLTTSMLVDDMNVSNLWKLDLLGITDPTETKTKTVAEQETDRFFQDTLKMDAEGRYEVRLPWKESHPDLPTNHEIAAKRLESTVKKLEKDGFYKEYEEVLQEWVQEGVIEQVPEHELGNVKHYLPHRHVVKQSSTTKVRPVFDASAHVQREPSLNDCLEKGCNMIEKIPSLLLRFRLKQIGVVADIRRAFLQISVYPDDRNYLCFLWKDQSGKTVVFRHKRVVFGVVCSPYQLNAVIHYHLNMELEKSQVGNSKYSQETIETLMNSFYVDNTVTSLDDQNSVNTFINEAKALMAEGKFDLRGWEYGQNLESSDKGTSTNVLGLLWDSKQDTLQVNVDTLKPLPSKITKRCILSVAQTVFDPIGFTSPVMLKPKLILRELWNSNLGWDECVGDEVSYRFLDWMDQLRFLDDAKIPRWVLNTTDTGKGKWSVHTFCDASELAYATAVFLRVETEKGVSVQLIQAKTRVAPVKNMTIPRLELLAALIGTRLHNSVTDSLPADCTSYFWSDSTTALAWIRREEQWAPFVRNRVTEIKQTTKSEQWNHVPGSHNPADLPSRGCSTRQLLETRWWEGPDWLRQTENYWPEHEVHYDEDLIIKEKLKGTTRSMLAINDKSTDEMFKYFSKYEKNVRMIAWIRRFSNNCKSRNDKITGPLSVEEMEVAEVSVLKIIQKNAFPVLTDPKLLSLRPFQAPDGLIRLKTKISNRPDYPDFRNPILLPKNHPIVERLIMGMHTKHCHAGTQSLLAIMREKFWILGGRKTIRSITARCMKCKRQDAKSFQTSAPPLPVERVRDAAAFEVTGVDLAGPLYLKNGKKCWICLFTCGVIRAVHLELLTSLTTEDFLQALKRFIARRGRPFVIFSDNGTNFKGTENLFQTIDWNNVQEYCTVDRLKWKFNPPAAPWWGGFFERLVGLVKRVLRKTLGRSSLTYCEMETMLCDCESIINSRPLTYISDDQNELAPITPAMFLQEIKENGVPELDVIETTNLQKKFQYRTKLRQDLRKRFRSEYLGQLRQQAEKQNVTIQIGDVVMIENENAKRLDWPLAKVTELYPGRDGKVRLVGVSTANGGQYIKPMRRLYKMSS